MPSVVPKSGTPPTHTNTHTHTTNGEEATACGESHGNSAGLARRDDDDDDDDDDNDDCRCDGGADGGRGAWKRGIATAKRKG